MRLIDDAPTIEAEPSKLREVIEPYREFCLWVTDWIFKEDFEESAGAFAELACRRLEKLGYVYKEDNKWLSVDFKELEDESTMGQVKQGHWVKYGSPLFSDWECSECGERHTGNDLPDKCPHCKARMDEVEE